MKKGIFVFVCLAIASLVLGQVVFAADMVMATWKLNLAKSKYSPANLAPKSTTTTFAPAPGGIKATVDTVDYQGGKVHTEYTAGFDGKDASFKSTVDGKPNPDQDAVAWKKIDDYTYENTAKLKGQVLTTTRIVISRDGKTRTNTVSGKNAQGQAVSNTVVFEKQ
jgi:hypothetical protein